MEYQDVVLSLPKEAVERRKALAMSESSSLSGLMTQIAGLAGSMIEASTPVAAFKGFKGNDIP